jgi:hypothetical protein
VTLFLAYKGATTAATARCFQSSISAAHSRVGRAAGVGRDLAAVDRDDVQADQASLCPQAKDRAEELGQRVLMALDEPSDPRVIGLALRRDHPTTTARDHTR